MMSLVAGQKTSGRESALLEAAWDKVSITTGYISVTRQQAYTIEVIEMNSRKAYEQKLQAKLDAWSAEIKKIEARANEAVADSKLEYNRQVNGLRKKIEGAEKRLANLKESHEEAWEDLKEGVEEAFASLSDAISSAMSRIR